jgi:Txe/YoeB family toxin of Txe-Axe toxin-antitoxin module
VRGDPDKRFTDFLRVQVTINPATLALQVEESWAVFSGIWHRRVTHNDRLLF